MSLSLFGMEKEISKEKEIGLYLIPKQLCTVPEQALFLVALTQTPDNCKSHKTPEIIKLVSCVSQNLKTVFNNPAIARDIIMHSAFLKDGFNRDIAHTFNFFGAQSCLEASECLYGAQPDPSNIEWLFNNCGAIINYRRKLDGVSPLTYWTQTDNPNSAMIIERLIALGADPNCDSDNSFFIAIGKQDLGKLDALLNYYTTMQGKSIINQGVWGRILILYYGNLGVKFKECPALIERLIENVPQESCTTGLMACLDIKEPGQEKQRTQLLQKFIDRKPDTGAALAHLLKHIELWGPDYLKSDFVNDIDMLLNAEAYSKEAITALEKISCLFNFIRMKIERNNTK